jgi:phosphate transport system permease protein
MLERLKNRLNLMDVGILVLALIPLAVLLFIIVQLIFKSRVIVHTVGFSGLFSTHVAGVFGNGSGAPAYGLIPGMWGTVLIIIISMGIAVPISLAIAVFSTEFTAKGFGKIMPTVLNILGGVPPIIYAMVAFFFAQIFIIPKFCGAGIPIEQMPVAIGVLPYVKSTLLGGIMLSLLLVPFLSPLFFDAIRDVPTSLKEASYGLGASRWHTLTNVTIPFALGGLVSASTLGILKAMGDVIIVGMTCGFQTGLPVPLVDVFEPVAPLTSTGAGFVGGFTQTSKNIISESAANFTGLVLLFMAFVILLTLFFLQKRFKKRYSR